MDSNLLTISNVLTQSNTPGPDSLKIDTKSEESRFFIEPVHEPVKLGNIQQETADNNVEIKPLTNDTNPDRQINASQKTQIEQDETKSEKKEPSKPNHDDSPASPEQKETLGSQVREVARNLEPQGGRQLAELITSLKANRILPVTAQAVKSKENKQVLLNEKKQIGLKTDLPEKILKNANVKDSEKVQSVSKLPVLNQPIGTKNITSNNANETESKPDVFESLRKSTDAQQHTQNKQNGILNINRAVTEGEVNNVSKETVTDIKEGLSKTNSVQSTGKVLKVSPEINENGEKNPLNKNKQNYDKTSLPRRFEGFEEIKDSLQKAKGSIDNSNEQKLNINNNSNKQKIGSNSNTGKNFNSNVNQIYSHNNSQIGAIEQSMSSAENGRASNITKQGSLGEVPADIGKQILESIQNSLSQHGADKQITVRLNPPELGTVFIKFQEQDTEIIGLLEVSRSQTRAEIEQALPQIIRNLSDSGINIKRLEVLLTSDEQTEQETTKDNSLFNSQQQQQNFNNPQLFERSRGVTGIYEWLANNINSDDNTGLQHALAIDSSINILM